jgi:hypothetical protein
MSDDPFSSARPQIGEYSAARPPIPPSSAPPGVFAPTSPARRAQRDAARQGATPESLAAAAIAAATAASVAAVAANAAAQDFFDGASRADSPPPGSELQSGQAVYCGAPAVDPAPRSPNGLPLPPATTPLSRSGSLSTFHTARTSLVMADDDARFAFQVSSGGQSPAPPVRRLSSGSGTMDSAAGATQTRDMVSAADDVSAFGLDSDSSRGKRALFMEPLPASAKKKLPL